MKLRNSTYFLITFVAMLAILLFMNKSVQAKTIYVDDSGGADYTKIQDAIDKAVSEDTIYAYSGIYNENIIIDKTLTLEGENKANTIIDGGSGKDGMKIIADYVNVREFTIENSGDPWWDDAGIYIVGNNNNITNCTLQYNRRSIYIEESDFIAITNCIIKDNYYGIYISKSRHNNIINCTIQNNSYGLASLYYGIYLFESKNIKIKENKFKNNGIIIEGNNIDHYNTHEIVKNTIHNIPIYYFKNKANTTVPEIASQVILANCSFMTLQNLNINNVGRGITIAYSKNCLIKKSTISNNKEHGFYFDKSNSNTITDCIIQNNQYGIELFNSNKNKIKNCQFLNNYNNGVLIDESDYNNLSNCIVQDNPRNGITIARSENNSITDSQIQHNSGEGIYLYRSNSSVITNCKIQNNNGLYSNAGIYLYDDCSNNQINNCIIQNNPHGISMSKGGNGNSITDCTIQNNEKHGIILQNNENQITNCVIKNNFYYGIYLNGNDNIITHCTVTDNKIGINIRISSVNNQIHYNNIYNNKYGINATDNDGIIVNATNNWWGHTSGPYHYANNTDGEGDSVTDYILFEPWSKKLLGKKPIAYIDEISPNPAIIGKKVEFAGHGTDDGEITQFLWKSNIIGFLSKKESFTLSNLSVGTHTITFKIKDSYGVWSESVTQKLEVKKKEEIPEKPELISKLKVSKTKIKVGENVTLDASESTGEIVAYFFDFGDGTNSGWVFSSSINHNYSKPGKYIVRLKIKDVNGYESSYDSMEIIVEKIESIEKNEEKSWLGIILVISIIIILIGAVGINRKIKVKSFQKQVSRQQSPQQPLQQTDSKIDDEFLKI